MMNTALQPLSRAAPKSHTAFRLPVRLRDDIAALARANDRSLSAEMRVAVREHLERQAIKGHAR